MNKFAIAIAAAALLGGAQSALADGARYTLTFEGTWTAKSHPLEYPKTAHFSRLIGATHAAGYAIFADGGPATPGLNRLSEMGQHSPLDEEMRAAMKDGKVGSIITGEPNKTLPGKVPVTFDIEESHPMVSIVAMIAPSPDWFAGVSGMTFLAPDEETTPRQSVRLLAAPQFWSKSRLAPVGIFTFTKAAPKHAAAR